MKKLICALLIIFFLLTPNTMVNATDNPLNFEAKVHTLTLTRNGIKTEIILTWDAPKLLEACRISCEISGGTKELIFDWEYAGGKNNDNCEFISPTSSSDVDDQGLYHYELKFNVVSGKLGNVNLKFEYKYDVFESSYNVLPIIVTTGDTNILNSDYTYVAGFIIGSIITCFVVVGTYLIIQISQSEITPQLRISNEDKEDE